MLSDCLKMLLLCEFHGGFSLLNFFSGPYLDQPQSPSSRTSGSPPALDVTDTGVRLVGGPED